MGNTIYSVADLNNLKTQAEESLAAIETQYNAVKSTAAATGLQGTAGELLQTAIADTDEKMEAAKTKVEALGTEIEAKIASENAKNDAVADVAAR